VVGFQWCAVVVEVRFAVERLAAVWAWCAVVVVAEEPFTLLPMSPAVGAVVCALRQCLRWFLHVCTVAFGELGSAAF
jgi:hypothetical protein